MIQFFGSTSSSPRPKRISVATKSKRRSEDAIPEWDDLVWNTTDWASVFPDEEEEGESGFGEEAGKDAETRAMAKKNNTKRKLVGLVSEESGIRAYYTKKLRRERQSRF